MPTHQGSQRQENQQENELIKVNEPKPTDHHTRITILESLHYVVAI